jgi:hypothetical protein
MTNPILDLLTAGQNLIRDPQHWTQKAFARTKEGHAVNELEPKAVCFCTLGALFKANQGGSGQTCEDAFRILHQVIPPGGIPMFNDNHTHAEVMAAFDRARELAA